MSLFPKIKLLIRKLGYVLLILWVVKGNCFVLHPVVIFILNTVSEVLDIKACYGRDLHVSILVSYTDIY